MDDDFKEDVAAFARFLRALHKIIPKRVDLGLVDYLEGLDQCGREVLRNSLDWEKPTA